MTLNCTATPLPHNYGNLIFPLTYEWYSTGGSSRSSSTSSWIYTIPVHHQSSVNYYCLIYRNGLLLGTGRTTLNVKGIYVHCTHTISHILSTTVILGVLRRSTNVSDSAQIQVHQEQDISLQVETLDIDIAKYLLELTWYHNGSVIVPHHDARVTLSNNNKTLTITNFTRADAGMYKAQFNQLFVHPYNENCKDKLLSLLKNHPVLKPVVFCVNMESDCSDNELQSTETVSVLNENTNFQGTFRSLTLEAVGMVYNSKLLKHSSFQWYRSGSRVTSSLSTLQRHNSNLSLSQRLQQFNTSYEHSGRYEVLLIIDMSTYLRDSTCQPYYDRFVSPYLGTYVTLAKGYTDVGYHKGNELTNTCLLQVYSYNIIVVLYFRSNIQPGL